MKQTHISLTEIIVENAIVARIELNDKYLFEIEQDIKDGAQFPPVTVYFDGTNYYLVDGLHRFHATKNQGQEMIKTEVHEGTKRDAILFSCSVNSEHGLRRTNKDKRKAVKKLLADPEWSQWSDGMIAKHCVVTQPFVSRVRGKMTQNGYESSSNRKGKDGRTYNTENIGGSRPSGKSDSSQGSNVDVNTSKAVSKFPLLVDDLNSFDDMDSKKDSTSQTDLKDSSSRHDNDNDINTDSEEQQDKVISLSKQMTKLAEQISDVTSKLSKIKDVLEKQSSKTESKIKNLKKLKDDVEGAWIDLIMEFDELILN